MPPNDATGTVHYLLSDHLGSMSASVDPNLNVTRQYFYPYGGVRSGSGTLPTAKGFTGQYSDATGLMYFNARYYSSYLGRFVSADTVVPESGNPQAFNRYSYVYNSPLKYTDPSGHCPTCLIGLALGGIAGAVMYQVATGGQGNFTDMMIAAGTGAVAGGLIGTGIGAAGGIAMLTGMSVGMSSAVAVGAGVGMIGAQAGYTLSAGADYNSTDMIIAAGVGGVQGGLSGAAGVVFPPPVQGANGFLGASNVLINMIGSGVQTGLTRLAHDEFDEPDTSPAVRSSVVVGFVAGMFELGVKQVPPTLRPAAQAGLSALRNAGLYWMQSETEERLVPNQPSNPQ
jgi:RHS repeat-associated protein